MNTILTRYSTTLLPLLVAVAGVFTAAADSSTGALISWATITQALLLILSSGTDFWLPLVDSRWRGAAKTGASIGFVVVSAGVTAWTATDGHVSKANLLLLGTAVIKALVTEVATWIRVDAKSTVETQEDATTVAPTLVTAVPAAALPDGSNQVAGDNLGGVTITSAEDAEAARAERASDDGTPGAHQAL